jgi:hypothetical protein
VEREDMKNLGSRVSESKSMRRKKIKEDKGSDRFSVFSPRRVSPNHT